MNRLKATCETFTKRTSILSAALLYMLLAPQAWGALAPYVQNFETLVQTDANALAADGWLVFGNVYAGETFLYGYGSFPAPNGGPAFSGIDLGQGGATQGAQQLVVYNDYNNTDHANGLLIESNVFQEKTIDAVDVGQLYRFGFDAKRGNIAGDTTALAFIKILDPSSGFSLTDFFTLDTTDLPTTWDRYEISVSIDADYAGQVIQFGFSSTATMFEPSGNFYDNIIFDIADTDLDGVPDTLDNCIEVVNGDQRDTNNDGFGNLCDADLNNDNVVNFIDLGLLRTVFFQTGDLDADFNGDGAVNFIDLGLMRTGFFMPPGPSGIAP